MKHRGAASQAAAPALVPALGWRAVAQAVSPAWEVPS